MPKRTKYRNGDTIYLRTGCNSCSPSRINGVLCHETGCPDAWKDRRKECADCGRGYYAKEHFGGTLCRWCRGR